MSGPRISEEEQLKRDIKRTDIMRERIQRGVESYEEQSWMLDMAQAQGTGIDTSADAEAAGPDDMGSGDWTHEELMELGESIAAGEAELELEHRRRDLRAWLQGCRGICLGCSEL